MSSVIIFYICTTWIKFTQLFILGFISSSLCLEDMSRERKHWLQHFTWYLYTVFDVIFESPLRMAIILEDSRVVLSHNCIFVLKLLQTLLNPRNISGDLCIKPRVNSTPLSKDSSRCIKCLPGFAGIDCVYMTWLTLCHCWWCQQDDTDHGACTSTGLRSPPDREY